MKTILLILLPLLVILSIFIYPKVTFLLGIVALFASLAFAGHSIIQKYKGKTNAYKNIFQEIGVFIITILFVILLGWLAGAFVNVYVSSLYGAIIGLVCGLVVAFAVDTASDIQPVNFTYLPSGIVSVNASSLPSGSRLPFFSGLVEDGFNFLPGGNYLPSTIQSRTLSSFFSSASNGLSWMTAGVTSLATNLWEYGSDAENLEEFSDQTFENQEFWASTAVDTLLSVIIGVGAAVGTVALLGLVGVSLPLWGTALVVAGVAIGASLLVNSLGIPDILDANANMLIDDLQGQ